METAKGEICVFKNVGTGEGYWADTPNFQQDGHFSVHHRYPYGYANPGEEILSKWEAIAKAKDMLECWN